MSTEDLMNVAPQPQELSITQKTDTTSLSEKLLFIAVIRGFLLELQHITHRVGGNIMLSCRFGKRFSILIHCLHASCSLNPGNTPRLLPLR
jgi:hypothetical protein